ncbi:RING finger protein [Porcipelethomonas sp.]|uniref:RING finger protein n=1 Tax=Porcipelethomonas sp. TaxID=2981675 RepID=UPI003EF2C3C6
MSNFTGAKCIICNQEFNDNDDIVVCPECGTPYHRECYEKQGKCINTQLHEEHKSWSEEIEQSSGEDSFKKCDKCGKINKPHSIVCENCGAFFVDGMNQQSQNFTGSTDQNSGNSNANPFMGMNFNPNDKYCGMNPDEEFDDVKLSEAAEFVGSNRMYYLPLFKRMKETGKKISMNVICFLFPQFYFANRKMWAEALLSIAVRFITSIPAMIYYLYMMEISSGILNMVDVEGTAFEVVLEICNVISLAFQILMCLFANWLYYRHTIRKIKNIKNSGLDENAAAEKIKVSGGTSFLSMFIAFGIQLVLSMILIYYFIYI